MHSLGTDPSCAKGPHCSRKEKDSEKKSEAGGGGGWGGGAKSNPQWRREALSSHRCDKEGSPVSAHRNRPVV